MQEQKLLLRHLVQEPRVKTTERPSLLLLLHGVGSNEHDLFGLVPYIDPRFHIVSARAPIVMAPGAFGWFNLEISPRGIVADIDQAKDSLEMLSRFIDELTESYEVDDSGVYLAGFSQGAMMSIAMMLSRPEQIRGVVAMSGRFPEQVLERELEPGALTGMPVLVTHGIYDSVLPIENGRELRRRLESLPVDLTYSEYPMFHEVSAESLRDVSAGLTSTLDARNDSRDSSRHRG
jgi:phospholipase/carboxylesterase